MKKLLLSFVLLFAVLGVSAQCTFRNTAFKSGEFLSYNLYYNWKFIWVKAGTASMYTVNTDYHGQPAYRSSLITRGNDRADQFFVMRDSLIAYSSHSMAPMYYRKGAREGKRYTVDEVFYSYPDGKCSVRMHRQNNDGSHTWKKQTTEDCVFDMLNMFMRARSFRPESWKNGEVVKFPIVDGKNTNPARIVYGGKTYIKGDNDKTYRCLKLSYHEIDDGKDKEIARFYISDDTNHVPIRLDMFLRFGSAKAFIVGMKGLRSDTIAVVK